MRVIPWALTQCRYVVGWSNADPAKLQARLPEGFALAGGAPAGIPPPLGTLGTEAFTCATGTGLAGEVVESQTYASIWFELALTAPQDAQPQDGGSSSS